MPQNLSHSPLVTTYSITCIIIVSSEKLKSIIYVYQICRLHTKVIQISILSTTNYKSDAKLVFYELQKQDRVVLHEICSFISSPRQQQLSNKIKPLCCTSFQLQLPDYQLCNCYISYIVHIICIIVVMMIHHKTKFLHCLCLAVLCVI